MIYHCNMILNFYLKLHLLIYIYSPNKFFNFFILHFFKKVSSLLISSTTSEKISLLKRSFH